MRIDAEKEMRKCRLSFDYWSKHVELTLPGTAPVWSFSQLRDVYGSLDAIDKGEDYKIAGPRGSGTTTAAIFVAVWLMLFREHGAAITFAIPKLGDVQRYANRIHRIIRGLPQWMGAADYSSVGTFISDKNGVRRIAVCAADYCNGRYARCTAVFLEQPDSFRNKNHVLLVADAIADSVITIESREDFTDDD